MKTCHEAMPQIKTKPPFHMRAGMCVCESISVCVSGHKMTAPMQWQQLQFVRACPRGKKQAREAAAGRVWLQLALAPWSSLQLVVRLVGHIYVRVQWAAFGLLYFQFLPLSAFAALRASLKGGRMQPQSNNSSSSSRSSSPHNFPSLPRPACDAGKFAARQRNEAMRTKSRN